MRLSLSLLKCTSELTAAQKIVIAPVAPSVDRDSVCAPKVMSRPRTTRNAPKMTSVGVSSTILVVLRGLQRFCGGVACLLQ